MALTNTVMSMRVISWDNYIEGNEEIQESINFRLPLALTIGVFDGIHIGHRVLLDKICSENSCIPTVVTFSSNPKRALKKEGSEIKDIQSQEEKLKLFENLGVKLVIMIDFSEEFCKMKGRDFIRKLLMRHPVRLVVVGRNFRCGHLMDTGADDIKEIAGILGVETWIAEPVMDLGEVVSSTRIRMALEKGHLSEVSRLLGSSLQRL